MADMRVCEVDDALPGLPEILCVAVDSGDPSKRLVRWRDVVAVRCKDDDWIFDPPQVSRATLANLEKALFAAQCRQLAGATTQTIALTTLQTVGL